MIVKIIFCPYFDITRVIRSNVPLCLQEIPRTLPLGTPSGKWVYLTVYPLSLSNTDTIYRKVIQSTMIGIQEYA